MYVGNFFSSGALLLQGMGFARFLSPTVYGLYKFIQAVAGTLSTIAMTGMGLAVQQATAKGDDTALIRGVRYALRWNILVGLTAVIISVYYYLNDNNTLAIGMAIVALLYPIYLSYQVYASYLIGKKDFLSVAKVKCLEAILVTSSLLTVSIVTNNALLLIFTLYLLHAFIAYTAYRHYARTIKKPESIADNKLFTYGLHSSFMNTLAPIAQHIDKILVFHFLGAAELAIYAFALAIPDQLKTIINFTPLMVTRFAERDMGDIKRTLLRKTILLGTLICLVILLYILSAPFIYTVLFPGYEKSIFYSQIYALSLIGASASIIVSALSAHKKVRELYLINTLLPLLRIILTVVLGYLYGIMGIILAIIAARMLVTIFSVVLFYRMK